MDPSLQHKIFETGSCLSKERLLNYHSGGLSPNESNAVEKHLLNCEICSEAMEGLALSANPLSSVGEIDTKIKILTGTVAAGSFLNWRSGMAIAASLVGVLLGVFWLLQDVTPKQNLTENKPKTNQEKIEEQVLEKQEESKTISDSIVKITTSGTVKKLALRQSKYTVYKVELQDEVAEEIIEEHDADELEIEETLAEILTALKTDNAMNSEAVNVVSDEEVSYNWTDETTIESGDVLTVVSEAMTTKKSKKNGSNNTLPTTYINELLVVDYSDIYSENDPSSADKLMSAENQEAEQVIQESIPAAFENDDTYAAAEANRTPEVEHTYESVLEEGLLLYKKKKYSLAINQFYLILEKYPEDHNALFYTGLSYVRMQRYNKAIENFDAVYLLAKTPFKADAEWQKALVLKKKGETEKAKKLFEKIISDGHYYAEFAKKELEGL